MKITSLTMIGNECEIIESFVRYNCHFIDEMTFVFDTGCIDNTLEILRRLQREGCPIILKDESLVSYEQKAMENKYLRILASDPETDMIIPLDADEFITAAENPRTALEKLKLDRVYQMGWKNYVPFPGDDTSEKFIPKRMTHCKKTEASYTKVMIPSKLVREEEIILTTGHHGVESRSKVTVEMISHIFIAHFPMISREQYQSKIYCNNIRYITWMNRGNGEGAHLNSLLSELEAGKDNFYEGISVYDYEDQHGTVIEQELELKYCDPEKLEIRYPELAKVDLTRNLVKTGEVMALKAYNLEIDKLDKADRPVALIYGTGRNAELILQEIPENILNIRAYIDTHSEKKFTMFHRRIVITPEMIRCFRFDKIIISSEKFYEEMLQELIRAGIDKNKIAGREFILNLTIEALNNKNRS
ncbi:glycosyltransferase family 2 protein [Lachnospiraceae bacterium 29-91]|nr:hypothetical protein C808_03782 [Lachnospiraceae bacterium M18-1]